MEQTEKTVYNGDLHDRYYASYKFAAVASCGVHVNARHVTVREKGREDWHLLYVERGELLCEVDGATERIAAGGYVIYPPRVPHRYEQNGGVCYWVHFSGVSIPEIIADAGLKGRYLLPAAFVSSTVTRIFDRMIYRTVARERHRELALTADLIALLAEVGRLRGDERIPDTEERLYRVIVHMHKHCAEPIDLRQYAEMAGLSEGRFMHVFKAATGASPYAYVLGIRLERAADLLLSSELSVAEVAYDAGFTDPLYFSRRFRKRYGASPEKFRKERTERRGRGPRRGSSGCD